MRWEFPASYGVVRSPPGKTIIWDSSTLTCVSAPTAGSCGYARMIQLQDRSLITVYEASGTGERTLCQAGHEFANGCWEPSAVLLPSGEIQLFFANEGPYTHSDEQEISLLRSYDNGYSWSHHPETVSFRSGRRDGMPALLFYDN